MPAFTVDEGTPTPILVDFAPGPGLHKTALLSPADLAAKSAQALDAAMDTIRAMAHRVSTLPETLPNEFNQVDVTFGVKLDAQAGALIAQASAEASFQVKLTWQRKAQKP